MLGIVRHGSLTRSTATGRIRPAEWMKLMRRGSSPSNDIVPSTMIKLLLLIPTLDHSGAEKQFALLATRLPRDEFDVHAVTLTRGGPYESMIRDAGVRLTNLNKRMKFDPLALWRLRSLVEAEKPDLLHSLDLRGQRLWQADRWKKATAQGARLRAVRRFLEKPVAALA